MMIVSLYYVTGHGNLLHALLLLVIESLYLQKMKGGPYSLQYGF